MDRWLLILMKMSHTLRKFVKVFIPFWITTAIGIFLCVQLNVTGLNQGAVMGIMMGAGFVISIIIWAETD